MEVQMLSDRWDIVDVVNGIFIHTDNRDWQAVIDSFADEVLLDYTSMTGGEPVRLSPEAIVTGWQGVLPGFQVTHHTISNHQVTINGDQADCFSYGTAVHLLPQDSGQNTWTVIGTYNHHLTKTVRGWRVDTMRFNLKIVEGNTDLPRLAQEAVQRNR